MTNRPYAIVEGLAIAALSVGAEEAILAVRAEYADAVATLELAVSAAEEAGYVGEDVLGSGRALRMTVRPVHGAYMLGEETVLLKALEGRRGQPEQRPPYPSERGLWGRPTLVHNVATLAAVPWIVVHGADAYRAIGDPEAPGTVLVQVSGAVAAPGIAEVPTGTSLSEIVGLAGGVAGGRSLKALLVGGPSGGLLPADLAATPYTFAALRAAGAHVGSGSLVVADDATCVVDLARLLTRYCADEACGKTIPCRIGLRRMSEIGERLASGHARPTDEQLLADLGADIAGERALRPRASRDGTARDRDAILRARDRRPRRRRLPGRHLRPRRGRGRRDSARRIGATAMADLISRPPDRVPGPADLVSTARPQPVVDTLAERLFRTQSPQRPQSTPVIRLEVDGHVVEGREGQTILEVCRDNGIEVPTLCYEPKLPGFGACRMCVVDVAGEEHPPISCSRLAEAGMVVRTQTEEVRRLRRTNLELIFSDHNAYCLPPCQNKCPSHIDIPGFLKANAEGEFRESARIFKRTIPFPSILGRVCPAPCEEHCRRDEVDEAIAIRDSHRYAGDQVIRAMREQDVDPPLPFELQAKSGKRVAVIGSGPAGAAAAYYLLIAGHDVTIYERDEAPGGMLRYGIPEYRLPKEQVLDPEYESITRLGGRFVCNQALGRDFSLDDLQNQGFDAVLVAIGCYDTNKLGIPGEDADGVIDGLEYLKIATLGLTYPGHAGKRVVVIGGGFTSMDCSRTSVRQGASEVTLVYRRDMKDMPASGEVHEAIEEGVTDHLPGRSGPRRRERGGHGHRGRVHPDAARARRTPRAGAGPSRLPAPSSRSSATGSSWRSARGRT